MSEPLMGQSEPIKIGRSTTTAPQGAQMWTLLVADQLVDTCLEWSKPVEFKFERLEDGRVEMWMRTGT